MLNKTLFKRIISFTLITIITLTTMLFVHAADTTTADHNFEYESKEITLPNNIEAHKAELIAKRIAGITDDNITTMGIACLFGHDKAYAYATETEHYYYSTFPRCRKSSYQVEYCTRSSCDYCVYTLIDTTSAACH